MSNIIVQIINKETGEFKQYNMDDVRLSIKGQKRGPKTGISDNILGNINIRDVNKDELIEKGYTSKQIYNLRYYEKKKQMLKDAAETLKGIKS